jgi:hypothetical protein
LRFEEIAAGRRSEYRGEVKHVVSGATRHFRDRSVLEAFLVSKFDDDGRSYGQADDR